jgi:hypothetical protein
MISYIHQPTPIQNTTVKGIAGGLMALGRGTIQLKIKQENKETIILVIYNVIYVPCCPMRLISPQQLCRKSKVKLHEHSLFTTEENTPTLFHRGDTYTCDCHPKTKMPSLSCPTHQNNKTPQTTSSASFSQPPSYEGRT